jgi:genome maintenance exonuclease 1
MYAGTTDLICLHENKPCILDFKQANKPKKKEWIEDYFLQLTAYAEAHDFLFNTKIDKGVILMCTQDKMFQEFIIEGDEFEYYKDKWFDRVTEYYTQLL